MSWLEDSLGDIMFDMYLEDEEVREFTGGKTDHELISEATMLILIVGHDYVGKEELERIQGISSFGIRRGYLTDKQRYALGKFIIYN
jgi:hypothetical protein